MSKYIKLDETVNALIELEAKLGSQRKTKRGVRFAIGYVKDMPTIDIVHCKDCKFRNNSQRVTKPDGSKMRYKCDYIGVYMFDDNFCSYGERKDDE